MKNKVLSVLLAVAMLAALVVPALAIERSTVEATRTEIASLAFGDWTGVTDGVITVKVGDSVWLGDYLAAYNEGKTAVRISPECTYALVANTDKATVNSAGYFTGAKPTADGEYVEVLATSVDNKELTFAIKVKVSFTAKTTAGLPTVTNATGFTATGLDLTIKETADVLAGSTKVVLTPVSYFTADSVVFTDKQLAYLNSGSDIALIGWVNKKVNNKMVKVPLWYAVEYAATFDTQYAADSVTENGRRDLNRQEEVEPAEFLAYLDATISDNILNADGKYEFKVTAGNTGKLALGESVTFSVITKNFPVILADGNDGFATLPVMDGTVKVAATVAEPAGPALKPAIGILPSAVTVEVGKFVDVKAAFTEVEGLSWGVSYRENASVAPDYSIVWATSNPDKDGEDEVCTLMGIRVGTNVVTVTANEKLNSDRENEENRAVLTSKAVVTVVPRVDAVVAPDDSDVPQTAVALLANLF